MAKTGKRFDAQKENRTRFYHAYSDEFVENTGQGTELPDGYQWLHKNPVYRACASLLYLLAVVFGFFYARLVLHISVVNRKAFRQCGKRGYFLYGNHTQPIGDVFAPAEYIFPKRLYAVASPANLGIPFLGKLLPMLGALPTPDNLSAMKEFLEAVQYHIVHGRCIVIYPEAHVWPYCSFVRPFAQTSFKLPVLFDAPAYCMTTTYQARRFGDKPRITVYIDGPFYPEKDCSVKEAQRKLHDEIYARMLQRSKASTCAYIHYVDKERHT